MTRDLALKRSFERDARCFFLVGEMHVITFEEFLVLCCVLLFSFLKAECEHERGRWERK